MAVESSQIPIYTIGYGNRPIPEFVALLKQYNISFLVDVRSQPWSKYYTDYRKTDLEQHMLANDIQYLFMGDQLGGKPSDDNLLKDDGKTDYDLLKDEKYFKTGLKRIITAHEKNLSLAMMCAELRPQQCHRSRLIGKALTLSGVEVQHIDEIGRLRSQQKVMLLATEGKGEFDLFD